MKKWVLMILSILMMLALAAPAMAQTGEPDAAQNAGTVSAPYTVEFTYDGNQYVMPGDSSVRLSAVLDEIGLTGEAEAVAASDESLFSASNETGEWIVTAHQAFDTTEWMKVTINGLVYEIRVTDDASGLAAIGYLYYADEAAAIAGNTTTGSCTDYTVITDQTAWGEAGQDKWYVVNSNVTISDRITVSGNVHLILSDGCTLTASKGITVCSSATFNIYAQTDDEATMGALVADATNENANWYAGIGGVENADAGMITINGGQINATGWCAAGIGSGGGTSTVGTITINSGIVTAQDNAHYGAGIGGGFNGGKASTINLNGGVIHAAGIGSGYMGGDCSITVNISDGVKKIVATPVQGGACIGSGKSASGSVTVDFKSGGNVVTGNAKDAVFYDTGEGSERQIRAKALNHTVTMSDDLKANITATSEYAFTGETVTLTLGTAVDATTLSVNDGAVATTDAGNRQYTFTMPDGDVTVTATLLQTYAVSLPANMEVVSATNAADADGKYITGTTVTFKASFPYAASNVSDGTNTLEPDANGIYSVTVADADITVTATVERSATIDLSDANGDFNAIEGDVLTGTTSHTVTIADDAGITLSGSTISGGIVCEGTATITLVGTNSVNVNNVSVSSEFETAGIQIGGSGTTLTIRGDGSLTVTGGSAAAGIGLGRTWDASVTAGAIVIEGGTVNASGDIGIGIGTVGHSQTASIDGISIKGGTVNASLGKGYIYNGCTATVGYIKIYDSIDMVDASKITESVTYMHDDTDVTASASTYFTISENGNRRIIVPKDGAGVSVTGIPPMEMKIEYLDTLTLTGLVQKPGTNGTWTWTSSNPEVFRITPNGAEAVVEVLKVGTVNITAKYESDTTIGTLTTDSITVHPKTITITAKDQNIYVGGTVPDLNAPVQGTHYTVAGLIGSDTLINGPILAYMEGNDTANPDASMTGSYTIHPHAAAAGDNYTITYVDGTLTISEKQPATVTKAPTAKTLTYNGSAQELVTVGEAEGGEMQYALGTASKATQPYTTSIPTATNAGTYYVWYKVIGNASAGYSDSDPICIPVTIAEAKANYSYVSGAQGTWQKESGRGLSFHITNSGNDEKTFSKFTGIQVDGKPVDKNKYEAKPGSVIISLKPTYLETLSIGEHKLKVVFDDGNAETSFTIIGAGISAGNLPQTGDAQNPLLYAVIALISVAGTGLFRKRMK